MSVVGFVSFAIGSVLCIVLMGIGVVLLRDDWFIAAGISALGLGVIGMAIDNAVQSWRRR